jgi:hypothetical protein
MKNKFIFLIVSCSDLNKNNVYYNSQDKYPMFKKMNKMCYDLFKNDINYFFVEYNNNIDADIIEDGNFIYIKGYEEPIIPNILVKKMLAINYIHSKYEYDYMIHTNLTSLWNIPVLLSLYNEIPKQRCFGGHFIFNSFITGTGIIVSHDLTPLLLQIPTTTFQDNEDVAISHFMQSSGVPVYHIERLEKYNLNYQVIDENDKDESSPHHTKHNLEIDGNTNTNNILYFRIKNSTIQRDFFVAKNIIKKLYDINV